MKTYFYFSVFASFVLALSACAGENALFGGKAPERTARTLQTAEAGELTSLLQTLDELAELERAGSWFRGIGLTESSLRERTGDYAGSVAAAFKELSWAYGMGLLNRADLVQGVENIKTIQGDESITITVDAILAFLKNQWEAAAADLSQQFCEADEPDGFGRWMILVCAIELSPDDRQAAAAYRAMRARYSQFPEYWYRGARAFSGIISAEFAENCINSSPQGPYAEECRKILALFTGLRSDDGLSIKTKREIETIITLSVNTGNPQILESLLPLIGLPDNPYTIYAVNAMRTLSNLPGFNDYFSRQAGFSRGRLAERLSYIARG
ncbi:MAG: hypothetical protein FWD28_01805 [Treponema sp.]|nr:hypothetical protein [Treponema sp.]